MSARPTIGDIVEIPTPKGLAYAQYTHFDQRDGQLIRVLPGLFQQRPDSFTQIVEAEERFYVFFALNAAVRQGIVRIVGREPVPPRAERFPLMRMRGIPYPSGGHSGWWLRDEHREWPVGNLTQEQRRLSIAQVPSYPVLAEMIAEGWQPSDDV